MPITFRPHHFLCTLCFKGKGYSASFVDNYKTIVEKLVAPAGDLEPIEVVQGSDAICGPCPHNQGHVCGTETKIASLDKAHSEALGIQVGDALSWGEAKELIAEKITLEKFNVICAPCQWKPLGICEAVLREHCQDF